MTAFIHKTMRLLTSLLVISIFLSSCGRTSGRGEALVLDSISRSDTFYMRFANGFDDEMPVAFTVQMTYVYPANAPEILSTLGTQMFGDRGQDIAPTHAFDTLFSRTKQDMLLEYEAEEISRGNFVADTVAGKIGEYAPTEWHDHVMCRHEYSDQYVASFVVGRDSYHGGAHGTYVEAYCSLDRKTGKIIGEADIFVDSASDALATIIREALKHSASEVSDEVDASSLDEVLYATNDDLINDNFIITATGLRYYYNPYEIAAYAYGSFYADLPWHQIAHLIRPDSPVAVYLVTSHE